MLRLPQHVPLHVAHELALIGASIPVRRLYDVGLVNRVTPPGEALEEAVGLASLIADNGPLALDASKRILRHAAEWGMTRGWAEQQQIVEQVIASADAREGSLAFAERRPPVWTGR